MLVTDDNNCYVNSQFTITEPDSLYISNISVTDIICYGETGSVSIFGNGGVPSYNEVILGGQDPNNLMSGNYDAIIIDQNGCVSDPVTFFVNQPLELQINYSPVNVFCHGDSTGSVSIMNFGGTPPYFIDWNSINFNDSVWAEGQGGFGYGDQDDGTIIDQTISVYFRKTFTVYELSKLSNAVINADYDDGYVVYLNGYEVGRSYNLPEPGTFVAFDQTTSYDHEASMYAGGYPESIHLY